MDMVKTKTIENGRDLSTAREVYEDRMSKYQWIVSICSGGRVHFFKK